MTSAAPDEPVIAGDPVDTSQLRSWLDAPSAPRILDVRTPAEFETAHIPGSYNVPLDTLREHRQELITHLDDAVVLVCRSGMRAQQAERAFVEAGLPNVHVLRGGITQWEADGGPLTRGRERWDLERQVRLVAGSLVVAGGLASVAVPGAKWLARAVGAGLVFAAVSNACAMGNVLSKLPFNRGVAACDLDTIVSQLARPTTGR
jgi:rhodanese-related sulfurtransferase